MLAVLVGAALLMDPGRSTGDEGPLIAAAHRLLEGRYADLQSMDGTKFLWHGPGLPLLLAPLVALGAPLAVLRLTSPLLMFVAVLLFHRLLRLRLSRHAALIGAYALGLYAPAYYVIATVTKDPLALVLSIVTLDASARYLKWGRGRHALLAGLALAALAMTRLEYGWAIMLALAAGVAWCAVASLRGRAVKNRSLTPRRWTLICAVAMLGCVPWLAYTYAITGHPLYWGNSGGLSLYWMSSPSPTQLGEWHAPHSVLRDPALASYQPLFHYLASLRPVQRDLKLEHLALAQAIGHPAKYGLNLLANLGRMFFGFPFGFVLPPAVIAGLIAINGTLLGGLLATGRRLMRARASLPRESAAFSLFAAVGFAVHLLPTAEPRLVIPLVPVVIWLIAVAFSGGLAHGDAKHVWVGEHPGGANVNGLHAIDPESGSLDRRRGVAGRMATTAHAGPKRAGVGDPLHPRLRPPRRLNVLEEAQLVARLQDPPELAERGGLIRNAAQDEAGHRGVEALVRQLELPRIAAHDGDRDVGAGSGLARLLAKVRLGLERDNLGH